ncbi:MAG: hypothetical protein KDC60_03120 [Bacteroidetes bacterium]|nr:hypothetical protein [Bacteroidota bacterium]
MATHYIKYYDLENYILKEVRDNLNINGHLTAFNFFCIVIWKANRAKTKIAQRLLKYNPDINQSVKDLTAKIFSATDDRQKLKVLIDDYQFRLPMSSAILSLRYPDNFSVYDVRVCNTLTNLRGLDTNTNFEKLWLGYKDYIDNVKKMSHKIFHIGTKTAFFGANHFMSN